MTANFCQTLKNTAINHIKAFASPQAWNIEEISQYRTPDCIHQMHPTQSIQPPFDQPFTKEGLDGACNFFGPVTERLEFDVSEVLVDVERRIVVTRMTATFDFKDVPNQPQMKGWKTEYMWLVEMDESGEKIKRQEEFVDANRMMGEAMPRAAQYAAYSKGN